jgi:TPR repeat protein
MMRRQAVCGAAFFLANVAAGPAQTDPGLSIKPAGMTLSGERLAPEKAPVDLSRPEPEATDFFATEEEKEFLRAAADGQVWAQARLGIIYVNTPDDNARMELGRGMLEQAAKQDSPDALFELAKMALAGRGMERSPSEAFDYMRRAAELGLPEAQYELASMYANGQGASQDSEQALKWARQAATQGQPHAMHSVSVTLLRRAVNQQEIAQGF